MQHTHPHYFFLGVVAFVLAVSCLALFELVIMGVIDSRRTKAFYRRLQEGRVERNACGNYQKAAAAFLVAAVLGFAALLAFTPPHVTHPPRTSTACWAMGCTKDRLKTFSRQTSLRLVTGSRLA